MGLSERHTQRLKKAFKEEGVEALVHKNIGRIPANAVKEDLRKKIIALKQTKSFDKANFKFGRNTGYALAIQRCTEY